MASYAKLLLLCASGLMMHQASFSSSPAAPAADAAAQGPMITPKSLGMTGMVGPTPNYIMFVKQLCAPSKERLATKATYQAGDLVRVVHGPHLTLKGKVLGSFADMTGKSTVQDVLETLKGNPIYMVSMARLVPNKARPAKWFSQETSDTWLSQEEAGTYDGLDLDTRAEVLAQHPDLLDPHRLYKIDFKKKKAFHERQFQFTHASGLEKIDQEKYDKGDLGYDVYSDDSDDDSNKDNDFFDTTDVDLSVFPRDSDTDKD